MSGAPTGQPTTGRVIGGPHCDHDDCSLHICDQSGYAEHPCQTEGCVICGAPSVGTPEHWAGNPFLFVRLTGPEQQRVAEYWEAHPLMRRAADAAQVIPAARVTAFGSAA